MPGALCEPPPNGPWINTRLAFVKGDFHCRSIFLFSISFCILCPLLVCTNVFVCVHPSVLNSTQVFAVGGRHLILHWIEIIWRASVWVYPWLCVKWGMYLMILYYEPASSYIRIMIRWVHLGFIMVLKYYILWIDSRITENSNKKEVIRSVSVLFLYK